MSGLNREADAAAAAGGGVGVADHELGAGQFVDIGDLGVFQERDRDGIDHRRLAVGLDAQVVILGRLDQFEPVLEARTAAAVHGDTPLTTHLTTPALIDARTGELAAVAPTPWYVKALSLSQPLHFGDYGGLALKILWALLDIATIVILVSGLSLWLGKGRRKPA